MNKRLSSILLLISQCVGDAKRVGDASSVGDGLAGWPMTVGVVEVGVVDTRYGASQPGADAER